MVRASDSVCEFPTWTLTKLRLVGFALSVPGEADPVPERGTTSVGFGAFELIVTLPVTLVADWGANVTVKLALCPADSVTGNDRPLKVNPAPLIAA